jgi:DNA repair protein RadA/Sms
LKLLDVSKSPYHGRNITECEVPAQLRVKHATGIPWIDEVVGGGFTPSTCWMVTGDSGAGKSTLMLTVADALTRAGHVVLYNGREESVYQVRMTTERLGLQDGFTFGEDVMVDDVVAHARSVQARNPGKRAFLVVDSLQCLDSGAYDTGRRTKNTPVQCAERLIGWAKETYGVLVLINHVTKEGHFAGDNTLLHAVDAWMHLGFERDKKSELFGERVLSKRKDRFGAAVSPVVVEMGEGGRLSRKTFDVQDDVDDEAAE